MGWRRESRDLELWPSWTLPRVSPHWIHTRILTDAFVASDFQFERVVVSKDKVVDAAEKLEGLQIKDGRTSQVV